MLEYNWCIMANKFKNIFLVCLDYGDDLNHVVARNPSLKKARSAATEAKSRWPDIEVYITVEKILEKNSLDEEFSAPGAYAPTSFNSVKCICGKEEGGCVSNLSCKCPAIAKCKQMKIQLDPFTETNNHKQELEPAEINIISIKRGIIEVVIPDWDPEETIGLSPNEVPREIMQQLEPGVVLEADVNLAANSSEDLTLQNLRLVYESDEEEEEDYDDEEEEDYDYGEEEAEQLPFYNYLGTDLTSRTNPKLEEDEDYPELPGEDAEDDDFDDDFEDFEENTSSEE